MTMNRAVRSTGKANLSDRQHQIQAPVAQGKTNADIAAELIA